MTFGPGIRLGPYEIVALIGAGGMGEVYRARDMRLGRSVAIKVLAARLAADSEVRARFEREGRVISSLEHSNICRLYDIGRETSQDGEPIDYIVLEYLEGDTLAARLARGPVPIEQALRYGIQICDALDAAHRRGLTHRDLKPGNVMLTPSGLKLLDFGLAKSHSEVMSSIPAAVGEPAISAADTLPPAPTAKGTILGTIQYMAPEQIEGREADARTDLWAFGCVLYEMVSGRRAFDGASSASLIGAILEREPTPIPQDESFPGRLWVIIRTCLEKDPDNRWQSARDLARELRWCSTELASGARPIGPRSVRRMTRRAWFAAAGAVLLPAAAAVPFVRRYSASGADGPPVIVLMDSTHPERVYDDDTRKAGGTNADDLTDLLRGLPVRLVKENTNATWHREYEVLQEQPALIVAHRSCFYDATILGEASRALPFINLSWDKFELFAGFVAQANPRTLILAYSRGSWRDENERRQWVTSMEQRFPPLKGRIDAMRVPLDRATFRNAQTGAEMRKHIGDLLNLQTT
jgi:serine/threonine protein kinase